MDQLLPTSVIRKFVLDPGGSILANVKGNDIRQGSGGSRIATMKDVDAAIDGPGGVTKAALWFMFIR